MRSHQSDVQLVQLQDAMDNLLIRLQHQFIGVGCAELARIHQLALRVRAFQALSAADHLTDVARISATFLAALNTVNEYVTAAV